MTSIPQPIPIQWSDVYVAKLKINHFRLGNGSSHLPWNFQENRLGRFHIQSIGDITPLNIHGLSARQKNEKPRFFKTNLCQVATEGTNFMKRS
jgi:hypothetical protein